MNWETISNVAADIAAFQVIPHAASWTAQILIGHEQYEWYFREVKRPFWDVFGRHINRVFAVLHTAVGLSSYFIYSHSELDWIGHSVPLVFGGAQLVLDFTWRPLFFNQKNWDRALRHSMACTVLSSVICSMYMKIDRTSGYLFLPYPCWWFYLTTVVWYVRLVNDPVAPWKRLSFGGTPIMRRPTIPDGSFSD